MDVSIITPTVDRPKHLAKVLDQGARQDFGPWSYEHLVIGAVDNPHARFIARHYGARYFINPDGVGDSGRSSRDFGVREALGDYVVFWDDDNIYGTHALASLYAAACRHDVGVCQCLWLGLDKEIVRRVPPSVQELDGFGNIDTMCLCVHRELALRIPWQNGKDDYPCDYQWFGALRQAGASVHFVPIVIGTHL
jgi:GT2 family glycosyltransferase